jgi:hypothetical protein
MGMGVGGHIAPAEHHLAFGTGSALDLFLAGEAGGVLLGQEDHADTVFTGGRQGHALLGHLFAEKGIRNLDQDAGAIALQRVGTDRTPVVQVLEDLETLIDDLVSSVALDMCDEADTTGVMFVGGVVKTLLQGKIHLVFPRHNTHRHQHSCGTGHSNCGKSPRPNREKAGGCWPAGYARSRRGDRSNTLGEGRIYRRRRPFFKEFLRCRMAARPQWISPTANRRRCSRIA